jgi:UPF0716 family protein affecting phage T7 exclusion
MFSFKSPPKRLGSSLLIAEIIAFVLVGFLIGFGWALLLILAGCVLGVFIMRKTMFLLKKNPPNLQSINQYSFLMIASILLIIPGFISDIIALLCLIPSIRKKFSRAFQTKPSTPEQSQPSHAGVVIDAEHWEKDTKDKKEPS